MPNQSDNLDRNVTEPAAFATRPPRSSQLPTIKLPRPRPDSWKSRPAQIAAVLLASLALGFGGGWLGATLSTDGSDESGSVRINKQNILSESELISQIAKDVGQSVVSVDVQGDVTGRDLFGLPSSIVQQSAGTGFIINTDGTIVTNRHVVPSGTSQVSVTLADGTKFDNVEVIGRTSANNPLDIAFLKIKDTKGKKLTAVKLGDSAKIKVGERVVAIGNALGQFQNTVTSGIISGYGRDVTAGDQTGGQQESLTDLFQTDAAINQGNSGGPLVNINGEVIGVNTAVAGNAQNIGFAIPINDIKGLINTVLKQGKFVQPYLGVRYVTLTDDVAYQYNLKTNRGAYLAPSTDGQSTVLPDSPAAKAGLKEKDIITKINNLAIDDKTSLSSAISRFTVGETVKLTVIRDGKSINLTATLAEAPTSVNQ